MEQQLHSIMQILSSAQWQRGPELDRLKSEHEMCLIHQKLVKVITVFKENLLTQLHQ